MSAKHSPLFLPCLRGNMGDWAYYSTLMPLAEVKMRIRAAHEIHKSDTLCEMIQRSLTNRMRDISDYLVRQPQHLFNSIIVGIYEGDPQWYQMEMPEGQASNGIEIPMALSERIGALHLSGDEKIFALDGQHRVEGIKEALERKASLGSEHLSVIFVAHNNSSRGLQRSRRLFATLNRYAKPVSKLEIIALDEDDPIAIATRLLLRDHRVLSLPEAVATPKGKVMPTANKQAITTAVALYEGLLSYFSTTKQLSGKTLKDFLAQRPQEQELKDIVNESKNIIDYTITAFNELFAYSKIASSPDAATRFRNPNGGNLLFRPVGFLAYMEAVGTAVARGMTLEKVISTIGKRCETDISEFPWSKLIFDSETGTMIASSGKGSVKVYSTLILLNSFLKEIVSEDELEKARQHLIQAGLGTKKKLDSGYDKLLA